MRIVRPLGVAAVLVLAGCHLSSDLPSSVPAGVINIIADSTGPGQFVVRPVGTFFKKSNITIPDSRQVVDSCQYGIYDSTATSGPIIRDYVNAGPSVGVQTDQATGTLVPDTSGDVISYVLSDGGALPFTPGSQMTFAVAGSDEFPAMTLTANTAGPYAFGPVDTLPSDALELTWSPAEGNESAVVISLQFASDPNAVRPDQQIYCSVRDDGAFTVNPQLAVRWRQATPGTRRILSYKWHTTTRVVNGAQFVVISQFDVAKYTFP
ncbi:MAG TPA: hypothetical protein VF041_10145 [Gemmatimonadaceae bacterium]